MKLAQFFAVTRQTTSLLLAGLLCAVPAQALAGTSSATMEVSLTILPSCSVQANPLTFTGNMNQTVDASSSVTVACSSLPTVNAVSLSLDQGTNAQAGQRYLTASDGTAVPYALYSDPARTQAWGSGAQAVEVPVDSSSPVSVPVYGRASATGTSAGPGTYSDSVVVTLSF